MAAKKSKGRKMSEALKAFLKRHGRFPKKGELGTSKASGTKHHAASKAHHGAAHHSGGGSTKAKPKPRIAVYAGLAGSALTAAGVTGAPGFSNLSQGTNWKNSASLSLNAKETLTLGGAARVAAPTVAGALVSLAADKLGLNRVLAKARSPVRF